MMCPTLTLLHPAPALVAPVRGAAARGALVPGGGPRLVDRPLLFRRLPRLVHYGEVRALTHCISRDRAGVRRSVDDAQHRRANRRAGHRKEARWLFIIS
eukprot:2778189-Prymnesium_polylepis.1